MQKVFVTVGDSARHCRAMAPCRPPCCRAAGPPLPAASGHGGRPLLLSSPPHFPLLPLPFFRAETLGWSSCRRTPSTRPPATPATPRPTVAAVASASPSCNSLTRESVRGSRTSPCRPVPSPPPAGTSDIDSSPSSLPVPRRPRHHHRDELLVRMDILPLSLSLSLLLPPSLHHRPPRTWMPAALR